MHTRLDFICASVITQPEIQKKIKIQIKFELINFNPKIENFYSFPSLKVVFMNKKTPQVFTSLIFGLSLKSLFVNFRPPPSVSFLLHTQMEYLHLQSFLRLSRCLYVKVT